QRPQPEVLARMIRIDPCRHQTLREFLPGAHAGHRHPHRNKWCWSVRMSLEDCDTDVTACAQRRSLRVVLDLEEQSGSDWEREADIFQTVRRIRRQKDMKVEIHARSCGLPDARQMSL